MSWQQLIVRAEKKLSDDISALMNEYGSLSITLQDAEDQPIFEPPPETMPLWSQTLVSGLFPAKDSLDKLIAELKHKLQDTLVYKIEILEDKDWVRAWMDDFKPMQFGQRLWICPSWLTPPDKNAVNIMLDPGIAFGTGTHPTTSLCLQWLDEFSLNHDISTNVVLDFGCGSGILSLAALSLGAKKVHAVDIDPQAIEASKQNATKNHCENSLITYLPKQFDLVKGNLVKGELAIDILLANILSGPLLELGEMFASLLVSGKHIVLSGLLKEQEDKIIEHYQQWFTIESVAQEQEWIRIHAIRK